MQNIQLSPHFKLSEFVRSDTATLLHIDNTPNEEQVNNLRALCVNVLEPLREQVNQPIIIASGYRCPALNKAVGGVKNSQHLTGEAVDIHIPDVETGNKWFVWMMENLQFDQLIKERNSKSSKTFWIHVSLKASGTQRQHVICNLIKKQSK